MQEIRLKIKKRAFPSHGRVRLNAATLPDLGITDGESVDLVNEGAKKTVSVTVIADTMVNEGQIRISEEDLKAIGLKEGEEVLVKKTPPLQEKVKKAAGDANKSFSEGVGKLDEQFRKTAGEVKTGAAKTADTVKKETKKAAEKVGRVTSETSETLKKSLKGKKDL
jgi:formylmethanofuran dehydrogenase subunit D